MKKLTLLFVSTVFLTVGLLAQKSPVVATVNIQRILSDYTEFQAAVESLKSSVAPVEEEMQRMQESVQEIIIKGRELEAEIENPSIDEERKNEARAEIIELQQDLNSRRLEMQQFRQQAEQLARQGQQEELQPLQEKALEVVRQVAKDKGIDVVLPVNAVLYASDDLEISDAVIAILNASESE